MNVCVLVLCELEFQHFPGLRDLFQREFHLLFFLCTVDNFANILFGATNRFLAKNLYVGRGVAKQIREVAVETLNSVRAVKEAYD